MIRALIYIISIILIVSIETNAQVTIERSVIGVTGSDVTNGNIKITSTIGEPIINTGNNDPRFYTQGFQQPVRITDNIFYEVVVEDATCDGISNGHARLFGIEGCEGPYTVVWSNGVTNVISTIADTAINSNLQTGNYSVQIRSNDGCVTQNYTFTVGTISNQPCKLKFYTGITPNGDGINDTWIIDSLELYPVNEINIFNRLGNRVWKGENYDNNSIVWDGTNLSGGTSPSDTYFFVFEAKGVLEKGWIELTR
jgi:gliding motility-associated-like protein